MRITTGSPWTIGGERRENVEFEASRLISKYNPEELADFLGRIINLLCEKGAITVQEAGNLFYEDWEP